MMTKLLLNPDHVLQSEDFSTLYKLINGKLHERGQTGNSIQDLRVLNRKLGALDQAITRATAQPLVTA